MASDFLCTEEEAEIVQPYLPQKSGTLAEKYQAAVAQTQVLYKTNLRLLQRTEELTPIIAALEKEEAALAMEEAAEAAAREQAQLKMKEVMRTANVQRTEWQTEKIRMSKNMIMQETKLAQLNRQLHLLTEKNTESGRIRKANAQKLYAVNKRRRELNRQVAALRGEEVDDGTTGSVLDAVSRGPPLSEVDAMSRADTANEAPPDASAEPEKPVRRTPGAKPKRLAQKRRQETTPRKTDAGRSSPVADLPEHAQA